jgi:hypothetical protein
LAWLAGVAAFVVLTWPVVLLEFGDGSVVGSETAACPDLDVRFRLPSDTSLEPALYARGPAILRELGQHGSVPRLCQIDDVTAVIEVPRDERVNDVWAALVRAYHASPAQGASRPRVTDGRMESHPGEMDVRRGVILHQSVTTEWVPVPDGELQVAYTYTDLRAFAYRTARQLVMIAVIGSDTEVANGTEPSPADSLEGAREAAESLANARFDAVRISLATRP